MSDDEILAALYDSVVENRRIEDALNLLAERFHCPSAGLISFDATIPQADSMAAIGVMGAAENLASYRNTFSTIDPAPKAFSALRQGDVSIFSFLRRNDGRAYFSTNSIVPLGWKSVSEATYRPVTVTLPLLEFIVARTGDHFGRQK